MNAAVPAITAHLSEAELARWLPIRFDTIDDPLEAPEPSLGALAQLDAGEYVVLNYGKDSQQLTVEFPANTRNRTTLLAAFLREVPLPLSRILWHQKGMRLPKRKTGGHGVTAKAQKQRSADGSTVRAKRSALRVQAPSKRK